MTTQDITLGTLTSLFNVDANNAATTIKGASLAAALPTVNGQVLSATTAGVTSWITPSGGGGGGTVTSIALIAPSFLSVSPSTAITTSGTFVLSLVDQAVGSVFAGPSQTAPGTPTFRALVASDVSNIAVTGVGLSGSWRSGNITLVAGANTTITESPNGTFTFASTGSGGGGLTSVSVASANGFAGTSSGGNTPVLTLQTTITGVLKGNGTALLAAIAGTDYQAPITLTTTGTSGAATFINNVLNIPNYAPGTGTVTSVTGTGTVSGLTLSGTVTSSGNITLGGAIAGLDASVITTGQFLDARIPVTLAAHILNNTTLTGTLTAGGSPGTNGQVLTSTGTGVQWVSGATSSVTGFGTSGNWRIGNITVVAGANMSITEAPQGTFSFASAGSGGTGITSISVVSTNGFAGTSSGGNTPALTLSTTVTGMIKGNGTGILAAAAGVDFQLPISLTTTGTTGAATFSNNVLNIPNYSAAAAAITAISIASSNGFAGTSSGGTTPILTLQTTVTGVLKGNGTAISAAVAGTDYQGPITLTTTGTSGAATFSNNVLNIPNYATGSGTVTSVSGTGTVSGLTLTGTVTTSGNITLGGAIAGLDAGVITTGTFLDARLPTTLGGKTLNNATLTGTLTAGGSAGTSGQILSSTGTGVAWISGGGGGSGTVTQVLGTTGNINVTPATSGSANYTVDLPNVGTAGTYSYATITTDAKGRVSAATANATPVTSLAVGASGTTRTGGIKFIAGSNITITDDGAGNFTFNSSGGGGGTFTASSLWASGSTSKNAYTSPGVVNSLSIVIYLVASAGSGGITNATVRLNNVATGLTYNSTGTWPNLTITVFAADLAGNPAETAATVTVSVSGTFGGTGFNVAAGTLTNVQPVAFTTTLSGSYSISSAPYYITTAGLNYSYSNSSAITSFGGVFTPGGNATSPSGSFSNVAITGSAISGNATGNGSAGAGPSTVSLSGSVAPVTIFIPAFYQLTTTSSNPTWTTSTTQTNRAAQGSTITYPIAAAASNYGWIATQRPLANIFVITPLGNAPLVPDATFTNVAIGSQNFTVYGFTNLSTSIAVQLLIN